LSLWGYIWRVGGALLLLVALVVAALMFYASTAHFSNQVRTRVIGVLEDATGGRVEIQAMHWNLFHLSVEVDNLTIHGLEAPAEKPYVHVDRLYARAKILSFFRARVGLKFLEVDRPSVHIIVYPDGHTNQPAPKGQQQTNAEVIRTIFDLQADRVEVDNGMALVNQRAVPFQLAANDLGVVVTYAPTSGHYVGEVACSDITVQQGKTPPVRSQLEVHIEAARDEMQLKGLTFTTGKTKLEASGNLLHFANPQWKLDTTGTVALPELSFLGLADGFESGTIDLAVTSHGSGAGQFAVDGNAKVVNGGYKIQYFRIYGVNATTRLHVTPDEILLPDLVARPKEGGVVTAVVRFLHYTAADNAPKLADRPTMNIRAQINQIRLTTLLDSLADPGYRRYGFDTTGVGKVDIDWTGAADDLTIAALLTMNAPAKNPPGQLPLSGNVEAKYFQRTGRVEIRKLEAHSPATEMDVSGTLGVWPLNQPSRLDVHMVNHNLGEFDQSLKVLGLGVGKLGISGLPVFIQGEATFDGVGDGSLDDPSFHGHLTATHFFTAFAVPTPGAKTPPVPRMITWDHLDATGGYSSSLISVQQATLSKGETVIHASGQVQSHRISKRKQDFDDQSPITATAQVKNAALPDLLKMAGVDVPATGTVQFELHAGGTMGNLSGGANLTVQGGDMYGQPYQSLNATVALAGQDINLTHATLLMYGGTVVGNGTYNLQSDKFLANVDGTRFDLAHLPQPKDPRLALAGDLKFDAHASGTFEEPSVLAGIHLRDIMLSGQPAGALELVITTHGNDAVFTGQSSLASAEFQLKGAQRRLPHPGDAVAYQPQHRSFPTRLQGAKRQRQLRDWRHHPVGRPAEGPHETYRRCRDQPISGHAARDQSTKLRSHSRDSARRHAAPHPGTHHRPRYRCGPDRLRRDDGAPGAVSVGKRVCQHEAGADLRPRHYLVRPPGVQCDRRRLDPAAVLLRRNARDQRGAGVERCAQRHQQPEWQSGFRPEPTSGAGPGRNHRRRTTEADRFPHLPERRLWRFHGHRQRHQGALLRYQRDRRYHAAPAGFADQHAAERQRADHPLHYWSKRRLCQLRVESRGRRAARSYRSVEPAAAGRACLFRSAAGLPEFLRATGRQCGPAHTRNPGAAGDPGKDQRHRRNS
jgi:translocation and assembly module TamB